MNERSKITAEAIVSSLGELTQNLKTDIWDEVVESLLKRILQANCSQDALAAAEALQKVVDAKSILR